MLSMSRLRTAYEGGALALALLCIGQGLPRWSAAATTPVTAPTQATLPASPPATPIATLTDVPGVVAHVYLVQGQVIVVSNVGVAMQPDLTPNASIDWTPATTATTIR